MTTSPVARRATFAPETDEVFLYLVTIKHPQLDGDLRFVANTEDITSRGNLFKGFPFTINFPNRDPDQPPSAQVSISAVYDPDDPDTNIVQTLRGLTGAPTMTLETVLASQPDIIEQRAADLEMRSVDFDTVTISGSLAYENVLQEPYPTHTYNPALYPGLFG